MIGLQIIGYVKLDWAVALYGLTAKWKVGLRLKNYKYSEGVLESLGEGDPRVAQ